MPDRTPYSAVELKRLHELDGMLDAYDRQCAEDWPMAVMTGPFPGESIYEPLKERRALVHSHGGRPEGEKLL